MCDCHKKNHTRKTCWDLHGCSSSGRDQTGHDGGCRNRSQGHGRDRGMECGGSGCQQTHMVDTASQSGSGLDDKMTQMMIQLAARHPPFRLVPQHQLFLMVTIFLPFSLL
jgi:hypothetical protein